MLSLKKFFGQTEQSFWAYDVLLRGEIMKKIFAFLLVVLMVVSLGTFCACDDNTGNPEETVSGAADENTEESAVSGEWKVVSTDDEVAWLMNSQGTLHITKTDGGNKYTVVCKYTYDKDTFDFEYTCLSASGSFKGTLKISGSVMTVQSSDGNEIIILQKVS